MCKKCTDLAEYIEANSGKVNLDEISVQLVKDLAIAITDSNKYAKKAGPPDNPESMSDEELSEHAGRAMEFVPPLLDANKRILVILQVLSKNFGQQTARVLMLQPLLEAFREELKNKNRPPDQPGKRLHEILGIK